MQVRFFFSGQSSRVSAAAAFAWLVTGFCVTVAVALPENNSGDAGPPIRHMSLHADKVDYDQAEQKITATGHAVVSIERQDSKLEADKVIIEQKFGIMDASGNVRITRGGELTTGARFRFRMESPEYLVTQSGNISLIDPFGLPVASPTIKDPTPLQNKNFCK